MDDFPKTPVLVGIGDGGPGSPGAWEVDQNPAIQGPRAHCPGQYERPGDSRDDGSVCFHHKQHEYMIIITVDGRNPAPVDMVNIPLFSWFYTSQVVQDFFHQQ